MPKQTKMNTNFIHSVLILLNKNNSISGIYVYN